LHHAISCIPFAKGLYEREDITEKLNLSPAQTALVAIDLQNLVVSYATQPYEARRVVENTAKLAAALRANRRCPDSD
jgi:hypothetical protein